MKKCYPLASSLPIIWFTGTSIWLVSTGMSMQHAVSSRERPCYNAYNAMGKIKDSAPVIRTTVTATVGEGIIVLNWQACKEHNTFLRYEVQRTADTSAAYAVIGKVKVRDSLNYTFTDFSVSPNRVYYYRLHQIGRKKLSSFSSVICAKACDPNQRISVSPNPANAFIYISNIGGSGMLRIYDQARQLVLEVPLDGDQQHVNVSTLSTGSYFVRIDREGRFPYRQELIIN